MTKFFGMMAAALMLLMSWSGVAAADSSEYLVLPLDRTSLQERCEALGKVHVENVCLPKPAELAGPGGPAGVELEPDFVKAHCVLKDGRRVTAGDSGIVSEKMPGIPYHRPVVMGPAVCAAIGGEWHEDQPGRAANVPTECETREGLDKKFNFKAPKNTLSEGQLKECGIG